MATELFELCCKDIHGCDFTGQAQTQDALLQAAAQHAREDHGMRSFPPQWWVQMRHHVRTLSDGRLELCCRDVQVACGFTARAETREKLAEMYAEHAKDRHGLWSITPELWALVELHVRIVPA
ncbi:MAG: DUF1059 domain-containing protein [Chloroflexi bacterium]|nr:DUF1059 domain-containing protein [Chloroflexota bacterium]